MRGGLFLAGLGACAGACIDQNPNCAGWAAAGECLANPGFMLTNCARSCDSCDRAPEPPASAAAPGGLSVQFVHALPGAGALEVSWVGDGRTPNAAPTVLFTLERHGEQSGVSTFLGACAPRLRALGGEAHLPPSPPPVPPIQATCSA